MRKQNYIFALILILALVGLTGCIYRPPVQQGTTITDEDIHAVHRGMTRDAVIKRLGRPVLINLYYNNKLIYIYTLKPNRKAMQKRQLFIYFKSGKVTHYTVFSSPNLQAPL